MEKEILSCLINDTDYVCIIKIGDKVFLPINNPESNMMKYHKKLNLSDFEYINEIIGANWPQLNVKLNDSERVDEMNLSIFFLKPLFTLFFNQEKRLDILENENKELTADIELLQSILQHINGYEEMPK